MAIPIYRGNFDNTKSYPLMSIVTDNSVTDKTLYISVAEVPVGSSLSNTSFWNTYYFDIKSVISAMIEAVTGKLSDLTTSVKTNLVSAINEVESEEEALSETVSDIVDDDTIVINNGYISAVTPNASSSVVGGIKVYFDSANSALYITNDGTDPTPT